MKQIHQRTIDSTTATAIPAQTITVGSNGAWTKAYTLGATNTESQLADGTHVFTLTATDIMGKTTVAERTVLVDTVAPEVTVNAFSGYTTARSTVFTGTSTDNNLSTTAIALYKDGSTTPVQQNNLYPDQDGNWTWNVYNLVDGKYTIKVTATDKVNTQSIIDTGAGTYTAPAAAVTTNGTAALNHSTWTTAGWTAATTGSLISESANWSFFQNFTEGKQTFTSGVPVTAENSTTLKEGKYKIHLYAVDKAGNISNVGSREFHVDFNNPTLTEGSSSE